MDTVLLLGTTDDKLQAFLGKMGYRVLLCDENRPFLEFVNSVLLDCIVIDERGEPSVFEYLDLLRENDSTEDIPLVICVEQTVTMNRLMLRNDKRVSLVHTPYSTGLLVTKIATALRLKKIAGEDEASASLADINAKLRDYTSQMEKELAEAAVIQRSLVPKALPADDRFDLAVSYEPLEEVGGDWYYVKLRDDGKLAVQIADVTGHGLAAAFISAMTKLAMTASGDVNPAELLCKMNSLMSSSMPEGRFVTIFSYLYDPVSGDLEYARGGHPAGLLSQGGEVKKLGGNGFAIGFLDEAEYDLGHAHLEVGDTVVIYSDALSESQNRRGEMFDQKGLSTALLKTPASASAAEVLVSILDDFDAFREARLIKDDVTVIVLKRTA